MMKKFFISLFIFSSLVWAEEPLHPWRAQRQISIIASQESFYPQNILVYEGETVRFYITTVSPESCFVIKEKNVFTGLKRGEIFEQEVQFSEQGNFSFFCPSHKIMGNILVLPKQVKSLTRRPASLEWMPRDDD